MFKKLHPTVGLSNSQLYDQDSFYPAFLEDVRSAKTEVIIESPFITARRTKSMLPILKTVTQRGVRIVINTKPLDELERSYREQASIMMGLLQDIGVIVLLTVGHHRKLAIIDRQILWEGSLNILSQNGSCEIMRRMGSRRLASQTVDYLGLKRLIGMI